MRSRYPILFLIEHDASLCSAAEAFLCTGKKKRQLAPHYKRSGEGLSSESDAPFPPHPSFPCIWEPLLAPSGCGGRRRVRHLQRRVKHSHMVRSQREGTRENIGVVRRPVGLHRGGFIFTFTQTGLK